MNTQTTQPSHEAFKPMATGRQLEKKRQHWQRLARMAMQRRYEEAVLVQVRSAQAPQGYRKRTWTVNEGQLYIGIERLPMGLVKEASQSGGTRPGDRRHREVNLPQGGFTWIEAGPLPDPHSMLRASANEPWYRQSRQQQGLAA